jgi:prepilin-type N-terminal cleavage/methylation domain-containing protein
MFNKNLMVALKNSFRGFTLVEMLLALAISSIVLAAIYSVFTIANKNFTTQNVAANVQQNLRSAIGLMARDIRLAGLDPAGSDNFGIEYASEKTIRLTMDSIDSGSGDRLRKRFVSQWIVLTVAAAISMVLWMKRILKRLPMNLKTTSTRSG